MCIVPGAEPPMWIPSGSDGNGDWATVTQSFQAPGFGWADQGTFELVTTNYKVKFVMAGHYSVDYIV